jgi:hypothetical protein
MPSNPHTPEIDRIRRMLHPETGRATVTISSPRDAHATFRLKKAKPSSKWAGTTFVEVRDEREQYGWRSVGKYQADHVFRPYGGCAAGLAHAIQLTLNALAAVAEPEYLTDVRGGPYAIQAADACGMCGRPLTHPDSIPVGIGPECAAKSGAFHPGYTSAHVRTKGA